MNCIAIYIYILYCLSNWLIATHIDLVVTSGITRIHGDDTFINVKLFCYVYLEM